LRHIKSVRTGGSYIEEFLVRSLSPGISRNHEDIEEDIECCIAKFEVVSIANLGIFAADVTVWGLIGARPNIRAPQFHL
jgi:hypothetical protein